MRHRLNRALRASFNGLTRSRRGLRCCAIKALEGRRLLTTYYVTPTGHDTSPGTSLTAAWKTIDRVNRQSLKAGDRVLFRAGGTYNGSLVLGTYESGTPKAPITFNTWGAGRAIINSGNKPGLDAPDRAGIVVANLVFRGNGMRSNTAHGLWFRGQSTNRIMNFIRVDDVDVAGYGGYDIKMEARAGGASYRDVRITGSTLHDSLLGGIWINGSANRIHKNIYIGQTTAFNHPGNGSTRTVTGNGIFVADADGVTIERCVAHDNGASGKAPVGIWASGSNRVTIQYCESYHNKTKTVTDGGGFDFDWDVTNSVMQYNYSHDNHGPGYLICGDTHKSDGNIVRYNVSQNDARKNGRGGIQLYGNAHNLKIYSNTIYIGFTGNGDSAAFHSLKAPGTSMSNVDVRNNIFYATGGVKVVRVDDTFTKNSSNNFLGNNYYSGGATVKIEWNGRAFTTLNAWRSASGREKLNGANVGTQADPKLKGAGQGPTFNDANRLSFLSQYRLNWNSPLINKGVTPAATLSAVRTDFYGTAVPRNGKYDVGANEF